MTIISTAGEAHLEVDPEFAIVHVNISAFEPDRPLAIKRVTERAEQAKPLFKEAERVETGSINVWPEYRDHNAKHLSGYRATVSQQVRVTDFTILGDLLARLGELNGVELNGPTWQLRPDSPHHRTARLAAVDDALRRARDYAAALGTEVTGMVELSDTGDLIGQQQVQPMMFAMRAGLADGGSTPTFDVAPARQQVSARVAARFEVRPPLL